MYSAPWNDRTHASWKLKDLFLSLKSSQYDRKCLVRDGHRSTANLLSFIGFYTSKLRLLRASCWCFAMTSACEYPQLTRTKLVCGQIGLACTYAGKSRRDPCELLPGACFRRGTAKLQKLYPVTCPERCDRGFTEWSENQKLVPGRDIFSLGLCILNKSYLEPSLYLLHGRLDVIFFTFSHDDVIKWKHFPRYLPFVREIHRHR